MLFTSERLGGPASSVQALININAGMKILQVAEKKLLDNKAEVTTHLMMKLRKTVHILTLKLGMEM
jgi:hypothetical protein